MATAALRVEGGVNGKGPCGTEPVEHWDAQLADRLKSMIGYIRDDRRIAAFLNIPVAKVRKARARIEATERGRPKAELPSYINDDTLTEECKQRKAVEATLRLRQASMAYFERRASAWNVTVEMAMAMTLTPKPDQAFVGWLERRVA